MKKHLGTCLIKSIKTGTNLSLPDINYAQASATISLIKLFYLSFFSSFNQKFRTLFLFYTKSTLASLLFRDLCF